MIACPPIDKWHDYVRDRLSAEQERALTDHVETCPVCEERLSTLVRPLHRQASNEVPEAPAGLVERLCRLWPPFPPEDLTQEKYWPKIEGYEILGVLGQGGMGVVYRAWQESLGRAVALKMIATAGLVRRDASRLLNDARTAARLHHSGIVPVHAVGEHEGLPYCVMELIEGGALAERVPDLVAAPQQAARLIAQSARALHFAHSEGVCHRDIKPANILLRVRDDALASRYSAPATSGPGLLPRLEDLDACVSDFGLARHMQDDSGLTPETSILGTPGYIAPEQIRLERPSPAADVFALGAVLYECVTGRRPFQGATPVDTLLLTLQREPDRPRLLNSQLPRDLETVCLKSLEKEPHRRYASAGALADDLERWLRGEPVQARRLGPLGRTARWCRRKPVIATMAGVLILAVAVGFLTSLLLWWRAVSGELAALGNLRQAEAARQQTAESYVRMSRVLERSLGPGAYPSPLVEPMQPGQEDLLNEAEKCLAVLVEQGKADRELIGFHARVLTQLGAFRILHHAEAAQQVLERAVSIQERRLAEHPGDPALQGEIAICCFLLEQAHDGLGHADRAQKAFNAGFRRWEACMQEPARGGMASPNTDLRIGWALLHERSPGKEVVDRLTTIRQRLRRQARAAQAELFCDVVQVGYWHFQTLQRDLTGPPLSSFTAAREAASILSRLLSRRDIEENVHSHLACMAVAVSMQLRRGSAPQEALRLSRQANQVLQALLATSSDKGSILDILNESWFEMSKEHWELRQVEETLTACRNAVQAARAAYLLDPAVPRREYFVADRYLRLGRKLCELGRLEEAEACLQERQAMWPGNRDKHAEALEQIRQWAARVGKDRNNLSPQEKLERDRYLALAARLERNGATRLSAPRP